MELMRARVVQDNCPECRNALLEEAKSLGGLPLGGEVVIVPKHWLNATCPHGSAGLKFEADEAASDAVLEAEPEESDEDIEMQAPDSRMDATKDIGYPVREHGPYGSHPMHDDFDDESSPDGSGTY